MAEHIDEHVQQQQPLLSYSLAGAEMMDDY
jgi:hypothetical protein